MHTFNWLLRVRPAILGSAIKRLLLVRRRVVATAHGRFFLDPVSNFATGVCSASGYEPQMVETLRRLLRPSDTFLDIGANEGYFSVVASRIVGSTGRVVAVEPQTRLQEIIFRNLMENGIEKAEVLQRAVSDHVGMVELHLSPDTNTGSSGLSRSTRYVNPIQLAPATTLGVLLSGLGLDRVDVVKMDIEGFEYEAVLGSPDVFRDRRIKSLALELHPDILRRRGKCGDDILRFLRSCGYRPREDCSTLVLSVNDVV